LNYNGSPNPIKEDLLTLHSALGAVSRGRLVGHLQKLIGFQLGIRFAKNTNPDIQSVAKNLLVIPAEVDIGCDPSAKKCSQQKID
jgi:hypothetical protein